MVSMSSMRKKQTGFTIVELLIVIVVIGILAAITIVAYNGIQNKANDVAVQSDLKNIGNKITEFKVNNDRLPVAGVADFAAMNLKVSKSAYGAHYIATGTGNNLIYCRATTADPAFALVAASKSGAVYAYRDGGVRAGVGVLETHTTTCASNGIPSAATAWLYSSDAWQSYIQ